MFMKTPQRDTPDGPLPPIPPGEILAEEFMRPLGLSQNELARRLGIPPGRVNDLVHGRRAVTPDTAVRLAVYFGTSEAFWINLQAHHDARIARRDLRPAIEKQVAPHAPHAA